VLKLPLTLISTVILSITPIFTDKDLTLVVVVWVLAVVDGGSGRARRTDARLRPDLRQRNARNVRNVRKWHNGQNARIKATVALRPLRFLRGFRPVWRTQHTQRNYGNWADTTTGRNTSSKQTDVTQRTLQTQLTQTNVDDAHNVRNNPSWRYGYNEKILPT